MAEPELAPDLAQVDAENSARQKAERDAESGLGSALLDHAATGHERGEEPAPDPDEGLPLRVAQDKYQAAIDAGKKFSTENLGALHEIADAEDRERSMKAKIEGLSRADTEARIAELEVMMSSFEDAEENGFVFEPAEGSSVKRDYFNIDEEADKASQELRGLQSHLATLLAEEDTSSAEDIPPDSELTDRYHQSEG